jgi:hypothetical protein
MTKYKYAYDNLDRLITVLKLLCGIVAFTGLYFYLSAPRTQKSLECRRIFDTPKSEINEMQQEYYNQNCK